MIGEVTIKTYRVNKKYSFLLQGSPISLAKEMVIEEGRFIFCASYTGSNGFTKSKIWILATPTKLAYKSWEEPFKQIFNREFLDEINLDDEFKFINNHLNKEVRYLLRKNKMLTSHILVEKYPHRIKEHLIYDKTAIKRMLQDRIRHKPTFLQKLMGIN